MNQSPLRVFLAFVLVLAGAMVLAALTSPAIQQLLAPVKIVPLHRVFNRLVQICVVTATIWLLVRHGLANREVLGFNHPWHELLRRSMVGLLLGLVIMAVAITPLFLLDLREWNPARLPDDAAGIAGLAARGLVAGVFASLLEEMFFRGAMHGALLRTGALRTALFAVPALYAAIHFFGEAVRVPHAQVDAWSGFTVLSGYFSLFDEPLKIWDAFLALYLVGVGQALMRQRGGDIAGCIGLHAGFVAVIIVFRRISVRGDGDAGAFMVGAFDGLLGLWIAAITGVACLLLWKLPQRPAS